MNKLHFGFIAGDLAAKHKDKTALCSREHAGDSWSHTTYTEFATQVDKMADALLAADINPQTCVGQFSNNKAENLVIDMALFSIRAIMVPMYATSSTSQVNFIVDDAKIEIIFTGDQNQYDIALEVQKANDCLKLIVVFNQDVDLRNNPNACHYQEFIDKGDNSATRVSELRNQATEDDLACILYTSGTTGNPKGVMLPHYCLIESMKIHKIRLTSMNEEDSSIAFLPLSHVFERLWCYLCLHTGIKIYINQYPTEIQQTIREVRPTLMCAVPRFWEKVYSGVNEIISEFSPYKKALVTWAIAVGKIYNLDYIRINKKPDIFLKMKYKIADKLIFSKLKFTLGIENANMLPTAGAKLADEITVFFRSIGVPIIYGYGLTESTATVTCFEYTNYEIGTIGSIMPNIQVRIGEDNEIQLKGKTITPGYYKNPEATRDAFTEDGWFRTGDAGSLKDNKITLTERIKDLFKTSNGKYIAPQEIETRLVLDKYIEQAATIGNERNFVTAIIYPHFEELEKYAAEQNIKFNSKEELVQHPEINKLIDARIALQQEGMANFEKIKRFTLITKSFGIETGELTNTLKIRRAVVMQKYKSAIDEMYSK